ncbi:Sporulation and spore germination [Paenibacillus algorifonticola]|uniref:Sporulation and spore germination n=1 Tax=Paenibacillus algorifonticola TaxID=684063 RepID=A0A1I2B7X6_9BACL|nr:GerMN domain-containing protein [Paenibacillus algorifonticola]SFE52251.1 Sporulation and spore germination [Paenibacillus algorifonticola]
MNTKITIAALLLTIIMTAGCADKSSAHTVAAAAAEPQQIAQTPVPTAEVKTRTIEVFYSDPQGERLDKAGVDISFSTAREKYMAAFKALQNSNNVNLIPLWSQEIKLKSVSFKDGALTLDIRMPDTARLGSGSEILALDALTWTLFQFVEVKTIDLLVDGKQLESLMGHADLDHPITRTRSR